jgi:hypothetical protein
VTSRVPIVLLKALVVALLAAHGAFGLVPALTETRQDFTNYYVAARARLEGRPLDHVYDRGWFLAEAARQGVGGLPSFVPHPPANAALLMSVAWLPLTAAKAVWTVFLCACLVGSFVILCQVLPTSRWWLALVFLLPLAATRNALLYGQPYPLLLLLLCASLLAEVRGRPWAAGALLAPLVVLKLYGVPFLLGLLATRRWRGAAAMAAGVLVLASAGAVVVGWPVHSAYVREVLPASLEGRVQDPYSTIWQSGASLAHRLFQHEGYLNPQPAWDSPAVLRVVRRAFPAAVLLLTLALLARRREGADAPRDFGALTLAALAIAPLTATYHFVLLILPAAVLMARDKTASALLLLAIAGSPLPHYFAPFASGWMNLLAYPRPFAVLALLGMALRPSWHGRIAAFALAGGLVLGLTALPAPREEPWTPVPEAGGYLAAEPHVCPGGLSWLAVEGERLVRRGAADCPLDFRRSPDGRFRLEEVWRHGSWDVVAIEAGTGREVSVTRDAANEREPAWLSDREVVFAADRRRGLGATALFRVPFPAAD